MIFTESFSAEGEKYTGNLDWNTIANAAAKKMQSFVSIVTEENFEAFTMRDSSKYHLLLFTDKKQTPVILKSLSKKYYNKLQVGEVRSSEASLIRNFGITKFPTLLVLTDAANY